MAKQNKGKTYKIITLKKWVVDDEALPKLIDKEFKYIPWDELMKEEENGNTK